MSKNKPIGERLRNYLSNAYNDFNENEKKYRCKIVNLELKDNDDVVLFGVLARNRRNFRTKF